jgi:uroporphyrinogen-III synthase
VTRPLAGKRILVAASENRADVLAEPLRSAGADVISFPTVRIEPPGDRAPLDIALRRWASYDWVVFTSTNGVDAVTSRSRSLGLRLKHPPRIAAVGPATRAAAKTAGLSVDAMPEEFLTDEIVDALGPVAGRRILLPRSNLARRSLARLLRARRAEVDEVDAYVASPASPDLDRLSEHADGFDVVAFTSASAVENLVALLPAGIADGLRAHAQAACIGPVTAEAARLSGFRVTIVARDHTIPGLVRELQEAFARG